MSISPSPATRHTALSVNLSEVFTSLTSSPKATFIEAISLSIFLLSFFLSLLFLSDLILSKSAPPLVID